MLRLVRYAMMSLVVAAVFAQPARAQLSARWLDMMLESLHAGEVAYDVEEAAARCVGGAAIPATGIC